MRFLFIGIFFLLSCRSLHDIAKDLQGEKSTIIIIDDNAANTTKIAAEELQYYLERIYGWKVPVLTEPDRQDAFIYFVGESNYTRKKGFKIDDFKDDSYRILGDSHFMILAGNDDEYIPKEPYALSNSEVESVERKWKEIARHDWQNPLSSAYRHYSKSLDIWEFDHCGSLQAVYGYLRQLGVRWYMPGTIGESLPGNAINPRLEIDRSVTPAYSVRNQYHIYKSFFMASKEEILYRYRLGLNSGSEVLGHGSPGHGIDYILASSDLKKEHPEYYAEIDGKRITNGPKILPCLTEEGLIDEAVEYAQTIFNVFDEPVISVMPPDGFTSICQCQYCQNQVDDENDGDGKYSNYVWTFVDEVARRIMKTHPEKKVLCFAYSTYLQPPQNIQLLSPNIQVGICRTRSALNDTTQDSIFRELTLLWQEKCGGRKLLYWDYYLSSRPTSEWYALPVVFPRVISKDLGSSDESTLGEFVEVYRDLDEELPISLATNHMNVFVASQYYWESDLKVEGVLKEYYERFYSEAANEMENFFNFTENNWPVLLSDPILIDSVFLLLEEALSINTQNEKVKQRIDLILQYISPLNRIKEKLIRDQRQITERTFRALNRSRSAIIVDGLLEENIWDGLHPYEFYYISQSDASKYRRQKSNVRFVAQGNKLYMGFQLSKIANETKRNYEEIEDSAAISSRQHLRLNIDPLDGPEYTILISPDGSIYDYSSGQERDQWQSNVEFRCREIGDYYQLEVKIPIVNGKRRGDLSSDGIVSEVPTASYPWYINIFHTQYSGDHSRIESAIFLDRDSGIPYNLQYAKIIYR